MFKHCIILILFCFVNLSVSKYRLSQRHIFKLNFDLNFIFVHEIYFIIRYCAKQQSIRF